MTVRFEARVELANTRIEGITLAGGTITHGANAPGEGIVPATCRLELLTTDANGALIEAYPELGWGDRIPSGFEPTYVDRYEGGSARIAVGVPVRVSVATPSGFVDPYVDTYLSGFESTRFVGTVGSIDYQPATTIITAVSDAERWTRVKVIAASWPAEPELDRVQRIATNAGLTITVQGESTATIAQGQANAEPMPAWQLLAKVAADCDALLYTTKGGVVVYRTRSYTGPGDELVDLELDAVTLDRLVMTQDAGRIANVVTVQYDGGEATAEDATSIQRYGRRELTETVQLDADGAQDKADRLLRLWKDATWLLPSVDYVLPLLRTTDDFPLNVADVLDLELDDSIRIPQLLPGSPTPDYSSRVVGWVETLSRSAWAINFTLDPYGWTSKRPGAGDDYIPPPPLKPSRNPTLTPSAAGTFTITNYDGNLTYLLDPIEGSPAGATLNPATGVVTLTPNPCSYSITTTEPQAEVARIYRRPYTYHTEDHGYWREYTVTIDESYAARLEQRDVFGDPCVNGQCPPSWYCLAGTCATIVNTYHCDYGGTLQGTTCVKVRQETRREWVSNIVTVKDPTPDGYLDVFGEWMRVS